MTNNQVTPGLYSAENTEKMMAWARYLYWADIAREEFLDFDREIRGDTESNRDNWWRLFSIMSRWYASMWTVIEGWDVIKGKDDKIGLLLQKADNRNTLKRYRNGVYHFQISLVESKFSEMLSTKEVMMPWIDKLHMEFLRYYWEWLDQIPVLEHQKESVKEMLRQSTGWEPYGFLKNWEKSALEAETLVLSSHRFGESELDLLSAAERLRNEINICREKMKNYSHYAELYVHYVPGTSAAKDLRKVPGTF
jgi:hypothetical protein